MKKTILASIVLLISILANASHALEAIGAFVEFVVIQGFLVIVGLILIISYYYKKKKTLTRISFIIGYTVLLIAYSVSRLPKEYYDLSDWSQYWFPILILSVINIIIIASHFITKKKTGN